MKVLVLNSGSSSQKSSLYQMDETLPDDPPTSLWQGKIEWRDRVAEAEIKNARGVVQKNRAKVSSRAKAVEHLLGTLAKASAFAPLHNRAELEGIEIIEKLLGRVPQVAVFDTGFHRKMPQAAAVYPGPYQWFKHDIRRYGFHGINHQYCATRAARLLGRDLNSLKLVTCHLGNGCSLAAIRDGHSIDTTMGFTPLEGLMMGTRSGSIDPGILTYLMRQGHVDSQEIDDLLNNESGLLGISGISGDMRDILAAMKRGHSRAKLAFDIYVHRLQAGIGAMGAVLGGIDALIFSGGVGENSAEVREAACKQLTFLGLKLDDAANRQHISDRDIAAPDSKVRVLIIRAQEDWAIARECWRAMRVSTDD